MGLSQSFGLGSAIGFFESFFSGPIGNAISYATNTAAPILLPSLQAITSAWINGRVSDQSMLLICQAQGVQLPDNLDITQGIEFRNGMLVGVRGDIARWNEGWGGVIEDQQYLPSEGMLKDLVLRGNIEPRIADYYYRRHGIMQSGVTKAIQSNYSQIPFPALIVDMGQRGVLDATGDVAAELLQEMSPQTLQWLHAQGYGPTFIHPVAGVNETRSIDFGEAMWAAHWRYPSFQLALEWQKRLRPDIGAPNNARDPSGIIITDDELETLARIEGVSIPWRDAYVTTSFKPLSLRFIRTVAQFGDANEAELAKAFQDLGYRLSTAETMALAVARQSHQVRVRAAHSASHGLIVDAWETGTVSTDTMRAYWAAEGLDQEQIDIAVNDVSIRFELRRVKGIISATRKGYLSGRLNEAQARHVLESIQVDFTRINDLVTDWNYERLGSMPMNAIGKLVSYAKQGIISPAYLLTRLQNLGMVNDDIRIIMADVTLAIQTASNKRLQALEKQLQRQLLAAEKAAEKALKQLQQEEKAAEAAKEKAVRLAQSALKQAQSMLSRHSSPSMLKKWLCEGLIDINDAMTRFAFLGWPQQDVIRYLGTTTGPCKPDKGSVSQGVLTGAEEWTPPSP